MPTGELIYNYPWKSTPRELFPRVIREFLDWGVDRFVFDSFLAAQCLADPEWITFLKGLTKTFGVSFVSMHGICGRGIDMNTLDPERRPAMIAEHIRCMEIARDFGSLTYTIHVGAGHYVRREALLPELREKARDTMEKLVPAAERIGIVLAVENAFEPPNSAREVLGLISPYLGNPAVGVCFDTGHANCMLMKPGKELAKYRDYMHKSWYETGIVAENDGLELLKPHIVTTHRHDNDGYGDLHSMPGDGDTDWGHVLAELRSAPRMLEFQTEVCYQDGTNWAGELLAPVGGYSIKRIVETFRGLGF